MIAKLEQQGRGIFQWGEEFVDITTLENLVYEAALRWGREIMRRCLEETDRILSRQRNKAVYRDKEYRPTTLKTVMGEVGIPAACLPAVRRSGAARHNSVPAGQEYGP